MRVILTKKDFKKPITIEDINDKRQLTDAETVKKFLLSVIDGDGKFKEIVITENNITIKTIIR